MKLAKQFIIPAITILFIGLMAFPAMGGPGKMQKNQGIIGTGTGECQMIARLPAEELSFEEEQGLIYMREEEKLARDVYAAFYDLWQAPFFRNISLSEQRHMNALKLLIVKYGLTDPVSDPTAGVFTDPVFQSLYNDLTAQGQISLVEALKAGAAIEELDIMDLAERIAEADNLDIQLVYQNLLKGSRNHLRAFAYHLSLNGVIWEPLYLTQEQLDDILTTPWERGHVDENGDPVATPRKAGSGSGGGNSGINGGTGECINN